MLNYLYNMKNVSIVNLVTIKTLGLMMPINFLLPANQTDCYNHRIIKILHDLISDSHVQLRRSAHLHQVVFGRHCPRLHQEKERVPS